MIVADWKRMVAALSPAACYSNRVPVELPGGDQTGIFELGQCFGFYGAADA